MPEKPEKRGRPPILKQPAHLGIRLEQHHVEALNKIARAQRVSKNEIVRRALDAYLPSQLT